MPRQKIPNDLLVLRRNRGLSRKQVATVLGYKSPSTLRRLEEGQIRPPLDVAFRLEILYRRPLAYLYADHYTALREEVRQKEERLPRPSQPLALPGRAGL